jgi:hypothetical protein
MRNMRILNKAQFNNRYSYKDNLMVTNSQSGWLSEVLSAAKKEQESLPLEMRGRFSNEQNPPIPRDDVESGTTKKAKF